MKKNKKLLFWNNFKEISTSSKITFIFGVILISLYVSITIVEWYYQSWRTFNAFNVIKGDIDKTLTNKMDQNVVYPSGVRLLWGGSTYWFTFMCNVFMGVMLLVYPLHKKSKKIQKFYFASIVYILIVVSAYWTGIMIVPSTFTELVFDQKIKSIIMHVIAPVIGVSTIFWERKSIKISNKDIWMYAIFPSSYMIFIIINYVMSYKFIKFGGTELDRGIVIYELVSFKYPLGYKGEITFIIVVLDLIMISLSILTAPIYGFLMRKLLRILKPHQRSLPKLVFNANKTKPKEDDSKKFKLLDLPFNDTQEIDFQKEMESKNTTEEYRKINKKLLKQFINSKSNNNKKM
ncbi:hypothetical protein GE118_01870 [Mycoplasma sp. NEAQ87857]|uniref:MAGa3780 family membrane protein n=1 Tax=Mycoplasma sp. NEAQ87857 TaxID=2683967 RepID=UPI00131826EE|nr:hypothetical protein [Mycoplasma sp. NEAQ87857]QGZ97543.1 hypothetical protein GE118_01870 [Mycoplasma sp. NEAQ87857]